MFDTIVEQPGADVHLPLVGTQGQTFAPLRRCVGNALYRLHQRLKRQFRSEVPTEGQAKATRAAIEEFLNRISAEHPDLTVSQLYNLLYDGRP